MLKKIQGSALVGRVGNQFHRPDERTARVMAFAAMMLVVASPAHAAGGGGDLTSFLQNIVTTITGTFGQLLAVIAVVGVGIGALMGAFSFRAVGGVILGVMLIFSSSWVVNQIIA